MNKVDVVSAITWLMPTLSLSRAPTAPVFLALSDPAKSTKCSLAWM